MPHHIFAYGSLMFPQVWQRVVRGQYQSAPATVAGYARCAIIGEIYPALIAQPDTIVSGLVYFDIDACDIATLDQFEGVEYRRDSLIATIDSVGLQQVDAYLYLRPDKLAAFEWQPEAFALQSFMDTYCCKQ